MHSTRIFWTTEITFFINIICGYTIIILFQIVFFLVFLFTTWTHPKDVNIYVCIVIKYAYILWYKFCGRRKYFLCVVPKMFPFFKSNPFVKLWEKSNSLTDIITNKLVLFPLFFHPVDCQIFARLGAPSNTNLIRYLSSTA